MKKKLISAIILTSLVLCLGIGTTVAWLTDTTAELENTFTAGNIDIELKETEDLDLKMVPGNTITKDPEVSVLANSEACYLFVIVSKSSNLDSFISYTIADGWTKLDSETELTVYHRTVSAADAKAGVSYPVLSGDRVTVLGTVTKAMMDALSSPSAEQPTLSFMAAAVQLDNIDDVDTAWTTVKASVIP